MKLKDTKQLCIIKELEKKTLQAELKQKELVMENFASQTKVAKMEQQKEDEQGKYVSADQISQLQCRINELEKQLKEERKKKEDEKEKYVSLNQFNTILKSINELAKQQKMVQKQQNQNCWDVNPCHYDLKIVDVKYLAVHYRGNGKGWRTVLAEHSIRKTNYFEILVKKMKSCVLTGFTFRQQTQLDEAISMRMDTYAYSSSDNFWIIEYWKGIKEKTEFGTGDTVGCGIHFTTRQIFFTKNGQRMGGLLLILINYFSDSANLFVPPSLVLDLLFPCVTLVDSDDLIEANFGPNFLFNVATL